MYGVGEIGQLLLLALALIIWAVVASVWVVAKLVRRSPNKLFYKLLTAIVVTGTIFLLAKLIAIDFMVPLFFYTCTITGILIYLLLQQKNWSWFSKLSTQKTPSLHFAFVVLLTLCFAIVFGIVVIFLFRFL